MNTHFNLLMEQLYSFADGLVKELELPNVNRSFDTRFYPAEVTVRNYMQAAVRKGQRHKVDQEAVRRLVDEYSKRCPDDRWYFRPCGDGQRMLLVTQTQQQRRMMQRYGSTIVGMDATYRVTKWGFPMFLITAVTNHGRYVDCVHG